MGCDTTELNFLDQEIFIVYIRHKQLNIDRMKFKILKSLLFTGILSCSISMAQEVGRVERLISPEISAQNDVTFRLRAPKATTVQLSGNWIAVNPSL
jgi:hypothetical protein